MHFPTAFLSYIQNHFGLDSVVVFDGYDSKDSMKIAEQQRRSSKAVSRELLFDEEMKTVTTQTSFLANRANKLRLIKMIRRKFEYHRISTKQAEADADFYCYNWINTCTIKASCCDWYWHWFAGHSCITIDSWNESLHVWPKPTHHIWYPSHTECYRWYEESSDDAACHYWLRHYICSFWTGKEESFLTCSKGKSWYIWKISKL